MCEFCNIKAKPNCIYILLLSSILRHTIEGVVSKLEIEINSVHNTRTAIKLALLRGYLCIAVKPRIFNHIWTRTLDRGGLNVQELL